MAYYVGYFLPRFGKYQLLPFLESTEQSFILSEYSSISEPLGQKIQMIHRFLRQNFAHAIIENIFHFFEEKVHAKEKKEKRKFFEEKTKWKMALVLSVSSSVQASVSRKYFTFSILIQFVCPYFFKFIPPTPLKYFLMGLTFSVLFLLTSKNRILNRVQTLKILWREGATSKKDKSRWNMKMQESYERS